MFCENCGNKILDKYTFCSKCGTKVKATDSSTPKVEEMKTAHNLEGKAWYRFVKVVYIIVFVVALLAAIGIAFATKPTRTFDTQNSLIVCDNNKSYVPSKNNIYLYSDYISSYDETDIKILCKYDTLNFYSHNNEFIPKNYTFKPAYID